MKIVLVGYMGSGKSIIGKLLSEKSSLEFIDLDSEIEKVEKKSIKLIFAQKGEIYFRNIEHLVFKELMNSNQNVIISTGGGTPCYANNHEFLIQNGVISIYLKASVETLFGRLKNEKTKRPLLQDKTNQEMKEFIAIHVFERSFFYSKCTSTILVDDKTPAEIVQEIEKLIV
jgi:shikimate kinase